MAGPSNWAYVTGGTLAPDARRDCIVRDSLSAMRISKSVSRSFLPVLSTVQTVRVTSASFSQAREPQSRKPISAGNITFLKPKIAWLMFFLCLILLQSHGLVSHHHHGDEAPARLHAGDHHAELDDHANYVSDLDAPHPEVIPHDEPPVRISKSPAPQLEIAIALADLIEFVLVGPVQERQRVFSLADHPYPTGPPGPKSSRAPPESVTA